MGDNVEKLKESATETITSLGGDLIRYAVILAVVLAVIYVAFKLLKKRGSRSSATPTTPDMRIAVTSLGSEGPPPGAPVLEFFDTPVRLAALVLAPVGRANELPPISQMTDVLESIIPGFSQVVATHKPQIRRWQAQLSQPGFITSFNNHAVLPGQGGRGTPWCAGSGVFRWQNQVIALGLVMRASGNINVGHRTVERDTWKEVLRARVRG